jgi:hypothetical protein
MIPLAPSANVVIHTAASVHRSPDARDFRSRVIGAKKLGVRVVRAPRIEPCPALTERPLVEFGWNREDIALALHVSALR